MKGIALPVSCRFREKALRPPFHQFKLTRTTCARGRLRREREEAGCAGAEQRAADDNRIETFCFLFELSIQASLALFSIPLPVSREEEENEKREGELTHTRLGSIPRETEQRRGGIERVKFFLLLRQLALRSLLATKEETSDQSTKLSFVFFRTPNTNTMRQASLRSAAASTGYVSSSSDWNQ